jgi:hypothetical protein
MQAAMTLPLERLRADTALASKFWGRTFGGLAAVPNRERGEKALAELWSSRWP